MGKEIYLSISDSVQVETDAVRIKDVATLYAQDARVKKELENAQLFCFSKDDSADARKVVTALKIVQTIDRALKRMKADYQIEVLSPTDCIVERICPDRSRHKALFSKLKVLLISVLCLFGGAFSIMAFHNDVGLNNVFAQVYELVTGEKSSGFTILEISYSVGLMLGIVTFYGHLGHRRLTKDQTPISVSMHSYEQDMNQAIIRTCEREGREIDAD